MSRYQFRMLGAVLAAHALALGLVFVLGLNDAIWWSALETRGVRADAAITGFERQSKHPGYIVDYALTTGGGASATGRSYLPLRLCRTLSIGNRIAVVYDPLRPGRSALSAAFPRDGGHPFRTWLREFGKMICLLVPCIFIVSVIVTWNRDPPPPRDRPGSLYLG